MYLYFLVTTLIAWAGALVAGYLTVTADLRTGGLFFVAATALAGVIAALLARSRRSRKVGGDREHGEPHPILHERPAH